MAYPLSAILLHLLVHVVVASNHHQISCVGAWPQCTTDRGKRLTCRIWYSEAPVQPVVCLVRNACLVQRNGFPFVHWDLTESNPVIEAWDGLSVALDPMRHTGGSNGGTTVKPSPATVTFSSSRVPTNDSLRARSNILGVAVFRNGNTNIGHVLGDEVWPLFQMLYTFEMERREFQIILHGSTQAPTDLLRDISSHPLLLSGETRRCFHSLLVGANDLSYSLGTPNPRTLRTFRHFLATRVGLSLKIFQPDRLLPNILVMIKNMSVASHKSGIKNTDTVLAHLRAAFPKLQISTASWSGVPLREQISIMGNTDIVFSLPGSDLMNALFLPRKAIILSLCRKVVNVENSNEIRIWMSVLAHLRVFELCGPNDGTFDGSMVIVNTTTLVSTVRMAIDLWSQTNVMGEVGYDF